MNVFLAVRAFQEDSPLPLSNLSEGATCSMKKDAFAPSWICLR